MSPASFSVAVYFLGSPAEVVTNRTPCSTTKSTMEGSRTKAWAMFTAKGLPGARSRIFTISSRTASSWPDDVSIMPMAPALATADASWDREMYPIGAWRMGMSQPMSSVTRFRNITGAWHAARHPAGSRPGQAPAEAFRASSVPASGGGAFLLSDQRRKAQ